MLIMRLVPPRGSVDVWSARVVKVACVQIPRWLCESYRMAVGTRRSLGLRPRLPGKQSPHCTEDPLEIAAHVPSGARTHAVAAREHDPQDVHVGRDAPPRKLLVPVAASPLAAPRHLTAVVPDRAIESKQGWSGAGGVKRRPIKLATTRALEPIRVALRWLQRVLEEICVVAPAGVHGIARVPAQPPRVAAPKLMEFGALVFQQGCATR